MKFVQHQATRKNLAMLTCMIYKEIDMNSEQYKKTLISVKCDPIRVEKEACSKIKVEWGDS